MADISDAEVKEFCDKVDTFKESLSPRQAALLDAAFKLAWRAVADEPSLTLGFDGCFKAGEADMILAYGQDQAVVIPRLIKGMLRDDRLIK
ncbi:hypothetical protein [Actinophytocola sp.]|uniref:hypothetical protein n=1 Tax=Actinophytocola sp. TaxID=1872138 RepID=UPI002ECFB657